MYVAAGAVAGIVYAFAGHSHAARTACGVPAPLSSNAHSLLAAESTRIRATVTRTGGRVGEESWADPVTQRTRQLSFGRYGRVNGQFESVRRGGTDVTTFVDYDGRTWLTKSTAVSHGEGTVETPAEESKTYRTGIENGEQKIVGHELVDGAATLHLRQVSHDPASRPKLPPGWPKNAKVPMIPARTIRVDTWVDASTYVPVRTEAGFGDTPSQTSETWLPRTPANVAKTRLVIPAGFRRQSTTGSSAFFTIAWTGKPTQARCAQP